MTLPYLFHGQSHDWVTLDETKPILTVRLATEKGIHFDKVLVRHEPDNEEYLVAMTRVNETPYLDIWSASFPLNQDRAITHYVFKLLSNQRQYWLDGRQVSTRMPGKETHFKYNREHQPPRWVSQQVFYQIFPDRFCNGKPELSVKEGEYLVSRGTKPVTRKRWGEPVDLEGNGGCEFYGGDLYGVESKLDYLQSLGVTALYLNPIFTAPSNHKYDTADYRNVDPHLGSNAHFAQLCEQLRSRNMRIMLDAVFNHTSTEHPWFNLQGWHDTLGAYQSVNSPYRDYYLFKGEGQDYIGWKGIQSLPVLNFDNPEVREYLYQGDDAVIKHWLKPPYSIDAWRFDVIHMLGEGEGAKNNAHYVKAFRDAAKQVNPDCYVLGEHFFEATQWLQGDQEDGAMNYYGFAHPLRALLTGLDIAFDPIDINVSEFLDWQAEARAKLPWANQLAQLNQLDSHDTARFIELVKEEPEKYALAATLLFSYVGVPCVYYGSELALEGSHDPDNRRCMPWDKVDANPTLALFQALIAVRKQHPALQYGDYVPLVHDDNSFVFARTLGDEVIVAAFNVSKQNQIVSIPLWKLTKPVFVLTDLLDKHALPVEGESMQITLPAMGARLLGG